MSAIRLVHGDTLPWIKMVLTNADDSIMNLQGAVVTINFRLAGTNPTLSVITCSQPNGGTDGQVLFNFPHPTLDVAPGNYEGQVSIAFGPDTQTMVNLIKFMVEERFA